MGKNDPMLKSNRTVKDGANHDDDGPNTTCSVKRIATGASSERRVTSGSRAFEMMASYVVDAPTSSPSSKSPSVASEEVALLCYQITRPPHDYSDSGPSRQLL
jgi:hypothetical protein